MTLPNDPAYPNYSDENTGLSIREYFAAQAMVGLLARQGVLEFAAMNAVRQADRLIDALNAKEAPCSKT